MTKYLIATAAARFDWPPGRFSRMLDWHTIEAESRWLAEACAELIAGVGGEVWCVANAGSNDENH